MSLMAVGAGRQFSRVDREANGGRRRSIRLRRLSLLVSCAVLACGCGSTYGDLDGDWDVTFSSGSDLVAGDLAAHDDGIKLTVIDADEGETVSADCRLARHRYEITLSLSEDDDSLATGSVTAIRKHSGDGCFDTGEESKVASVIEAHRRAEQSSDFGDLGGEWDVAVEGDDCTISVLDAAFNGSCGGGYSFKGSLDSDRLIGEGSDGLDFVAERR